MHKCDVTETLEVNLLFSFECLFLTLHVFRDFLKLIVDCHVISRLFNVIVYMRQLGYC